MLTGSGGKMSKEMTNRNIQTELQAKRNYAKNVNFFIKTIYIWYLNN